MGSGCDNIAQLTAVWRDPAALTISAHTSGSTGAPKEIRLPKADMRVSAEATCSAFRLHAGSWLHCPLSLDYIAGKMMVVRALVSGARLTTETPSSAPLPQRLGDRPIDLLPIVPAQIEGLLANLQAHGQPVRNVIVGGAPCTERQEQMLRKAPLRAFATYGMTETCSHVALRDISSDDDCYRALPSVTFDTDERGCLVILSDAYSWRRLVTNDVVELLSPTSFRWAGRADHVIITGGLKVHPEELERRIARIMPELGPIIIGAEPSEQWGQTVTLTVESAEPVDQERIIGALRPHLAAHELPRRVTSCPQLPRTPSGKILRRQL